MVEEAGRLRAFGPARPGRIAQGVEHAAQADDDGEHAWRDADDLGEAPLQLALADAGDRAQCRQRDPAFARKQPLDAELDRVIAAAVHRGDPRRDIATGDRDPLVLVGDARQSRAERCRRRRAVQRGEIDAVVGAARQRPADEGPRPGRGEANADHRDRAARAQDERARQLAGEQKRRLNLPGAIAAALLVRPASMDDQLAAAVGRHGLLEPVLVAGERPAAMDVRRKRRVGRELLIARRHRASASSRTSIQCRTGVAVPLCRCWMQPMLAETIASGASSSRWASLRSRSACASVGCSTE